MKQIKSVAFDLDGTLINTQGDISTALNRALNSKNIRSLTDSEVKKFVGMGELKLIELTLNYLEYDQSLISELHPLYLENYVEINGQFSNIYPNGLKLMKLLKKKNIKMGIITNKSEKLALPVLNYFNISEYFDTVICGDTLTSKKPNPEGIEHLLKQQQTAKESFLFVGDSPTDIKTAQNADCEIICLEHGFPQGEDLHNYPITILKDFYQLETHINKLI